MNCNDDEQLLLHYEGTNNFELGNIYNYEVSTIIYGQLKFLSNEINKLNSGYIVVPAYKYKGNVIQIQLAVTGKCKNNEIPVDGVRREVVEEIGFTLNEEDNKIPIKKLEDKQNNLYFSFLDNLKLEANKLETNYQSCNNDNPKEKIISWIYQDEIDEELIFNRKRRNSKDEAGQIIAILPVNLVKLIMSKWSKNEIKRVDRFGFVLKN
jgi:hypothetical protein